MSKLSLYKKLLEIQQECPALLHTEKNPYYKSMYTPLPNILNIVLPILGAKGILYTATEEEPNILTSRLIDIESGEEIKTNWPIDGSKLIDVKSKDNIQTITVEDIQKRGAQYTYARRYSLLSLLGLATEKDDDGNGALSHNKSNITYATAEECKYCVRLIDRNLNSFKKLVTDAKKRADIVSKANTGKLTKKQVEWVIDNLIDIDSCNSNHAIDNFDWSTAALSND